MADDSPPPAYSQLDNDPFVDAPSPPAPNQPRGAQPARIDYRALHQYAPDIPSPEDFVRPSGAPLDGKYYTVTVGTDLIITDVWAIAADKVLRVPGGLLKTHTLWNQAIEHYTRCFEAGVLKTVPQTNASSTPGHSASTPATVHSAAPTPNRGNSAFPIYVASSPAPPVTPTPATVHSAAPTPNRGNSSFPIYVASSPAAPPVTPSASTQRSSRHNSGAAARTYIRGRGTTPIYVSSSPISTPHASPIKRISNPRDPEREAYFTNAFAKLANETKAGSSAPAWRDSTPISIPGASQIARQSAMAALDGRESTPPSTPANSAIAPSASDGRDSTPPLTPKGKGKEKAAEDSDDEEQYYRDLAPLTEQDLDDLYQWEQLLELQQALSSPRFD